MNTLGEVTGFEWMDRTFTWLITNWNTVRLLVIGWGALGIARLIDNIAIYASGPPKLNAPFMPMYRSGVAFCWLDSSPLLGLFISIALLLPSIVGAVLAWFRLRAGYLCSAVGWVMLWSSPFLHSHFLDEKPTLGWRSLAIVGIVPILLLLAAWRTGGRKVAMPATGHP